MAFVTDIISFIGGFYCYLLGARLLLQLAQADFYNPISQMIARFTAPLVHPLQKVLPPIGRFNTATFVILLAIQTLIAGLQYGGGSILGLFVIGTYYSVETALNIYLFSFFVIFIASWVAPGSSHPGLQLVHQIAEPVIKPIRNLIPPMGGLDFSLMITMFALWMLDKHLITPLFSALLSSVQ
ncbi:YggT family protein [Porticoccus sp. W117]|uniref:YggT family protein n=1 Tax=Porticoccus sp. W117 TaxID=3054777 RepID=UPI002595B037|nr:YggT family protein [Porticoccus sp. W117]MDM3872043.1 YggT family protein [Porticoccus sp. W117]